MSLHKGKLQGVCKSLQNDQTLKEGLQIIIKQ